MYKIHIISTRKGNENRYSGKVVSVIDCNVIQDVKSIFFPSMKEFLLKTSS